MCGTDLLNRSFALDFNRKANSHHRSRQHERCEETCRRNLLTQEPVTTLTVGANISS